MDAVVGTSKNFLSSLSTRPVAGQPITPTLREMPSEGVGTLHALSDFWDRFGEGLSAAVGPRYWGYVTGGVTPAALLGDWLCSTIDQNTTGFGDSADQWVEVETIQMLCDLLELPPSFRGAFVSGATMATFTGLGLAREWICERRGEGSVSESGMFGKKAIPVLSCTPHTTSLKALSLLGLGRQYLPVASINGREKMDLGDLEQKLTQLKSPAIVLASAGAVLTGDFDDLEGIARLKNKFEFWFHVDGAFGAYARAIDTHKALIQGLEHSDSITLDAHKWLNVPYDSGIYLTRRGELLEKVFHNRAAYLGTPENSRPVYAHETPNGSRRFRALPTWMNFMAYGKEGMKSIFSANCQQARHFAEGLAKIKQFRVLSPVHLNVVLFTLAEGESESVSDFLRRVNHQGRVFLSPGSWNGMPAIRACFSNWRTTQKDVEMVLEELAETVRI